MITAINDGLADLHTHILPGLDDGARTLDDSIQLLKMEAAQGVVALALTPHFSFERSSLDNFVALRQRAFAQLQAAAATLPNMPKLYLGAEVAFSPRILEIDMRQLCYSGSSCMLVELPMNYSPRWTEDVLFEMSVAGITPVLAHVERYSYLLSAPDALASLIKAGAVAQVNAGSLLGEGKRRKEVLRLIKNGLAHVMVSDAHSVANRPPRLAEGLAVVAKKLGDGAAQGMQAKAAAILG